MIAGKLLDGAAARRKTASAPPISAVAISGDKERKAVDYSGVASCRKCRGAQAGDSMAQAPADAESSVQSSDAFGKVLSRIYDGIPRDRSHCYHEAGHAVAGMFLGNVVRQVNVDGSVTTSFEYVNDTTVGEIVIITAAGNIAENWLLRRVDRPFDGEFVFALECARAKERHGCDRCAAIRVIASNFPDATDEEVVAFYRRFEAKTIELVQRPDIWRSIRAVAAALEEHGHLDDAGVRRLCRFEGGRHD